MNIHNNIYELRMLPFLLTTLWMEYLTTPQIGGNQQHNEYKQFICSIEILDNCIIEANSTIMYNVKIGPNAIVAARSAVTKDVLEGTIVGGNPAKVIGSFDALM
jgi:acetyltransferase-like isoleucine patch superfamily enzyme